MAHDFGDFRKEAEKADQGFGVHSRWTFGDMCIFLLELWEHSRSCHSKAHPLLGCVTSCQLCKWRRKITSCFYFSLWNHENSKHMVLTLPGIKGSSWHCPSRWARLSVHLTTSYRALLPQSFAGSGLRACHFKRGLAFGLCCFEISIKALALPPPCIICEFLIWRMTGQFWIIQFCPLWTSFASFFFSLYIFLVPFVLGYPLPL